MHLIYMTAPSKDEALKISRTLVEEKLIACANVIDQVTSVYEWEGKINEDAEVVVIGKTSEATISNAIERIKQLHSYDCPCVLSYKIEKANEDFVKWVELSTKVPY